MKNMIERTGYENRREAYCKWHNKPLRDVTEHEQFSCGSSCMTCELLVSGSEDGNE